MRPGLGLPPPTIINIYHPVPSHHPPPSFAPCTPPLSTLASRGGFSTVERLRSSVPAPGRPCFFFASQRGWSPGTSDLLRGHARMALTSKSRHVCFLSVTSQ